MIHNCLPFIRNDQKEVFCRRIIAPNFCPVFWLEEAEDGCIFDEQIKVNTKINPRILLAKAFIMIIK